MVSQKIEAARQGRNAHIDFLRGIAILLVLMLHYALAYKLANFPLVSLLGREPLRAFFLNGNYGVTMFFVVSGYLITSMSLARWGEPAGMDLRAFYIYRFARIMPCILLALAIIVALGFLDVGYFQNQKVGIDVAVLSVLTFWHNVLMQTAGWFNYCMNIYWSLSVEEVFYLVLPLAFLALRRRWAIVLACLALIVIAPWYRSLHTDNELFYECGYLANFDAIAMGCLVALFASRQVIDGGKAKLLRVVGGLGIVVFYLRGIDTHEVSGFSLVAFCTALYLVGSVRDPATSFATGKATAFVRWFGRHSYELYLFHIIVLALFRNIRDRDDLPAAAWLPWMLLYIAVSALVAMTVARLLSEPANRAIRARLRV
jgi:peptidoglycan/LPS O-acetylase OafA/YrhL